MIPLQVVSLLLVAASGLSVVLIRDPRRQVVANGLYGLVLVVMFMVFQAPDVALSMLAVGAIAYPLVVLVAISRVRGETYDKAGERRWPGRPDWRCSRSPEQASRRCCSGRSSTCRPSATTAGRTGSS